FTNGGFSAPASTTAAAATAGNVSLPSSQFASLCAQLDPPDGLLLGSRELESRTVRTDQAEAATTASRRYRVVSLAPLPRLAVSGAASAARAAAEATDGAVIGWYRRRIGDCLRPEQQPQLVQLSAKEAHIHRRLCEEFKQPDLLLVLVQHARDATTQALVTDTTALQLHPGSGGVSGGAMECLPMEVLPVCRTHLAPQRGGGTAAGAASEAAGGGSDGSCDTVRALRQADRLRCGHLAAELASAADAGFVESQAALEALVELLARPPKPTRGDIGEGDARGVADGGRKLQLEQQESPVF
ncbi:hypothetical protein BOX15_Mlig018023g1, partial [Macrostomum lignano]